MNILDVYECKITILQHEQYILIHVRIHCVGIEKDVVLTVSEYTCTYVSHSDDITSLYNFCPESFEIFFRNMISHATCGVMRSWCRLIIIASRLPLLRGKSSVQLYKHVTCGRSHTYIHISHYQGNDIENGHVAT